MRPSTGPTHRLPSSDVLEGPWMLVFGGVTRPGNRRARRAIEWASRAEMCVVWFDGFGETEPNTGERVPAEIEDDRLWIIDIVPAEAATLAARLRTGQVFGPKIGKYFWRIAGRRLGQVFRPRACWKVVCSEIKSLTLGNPPDVIIVGDDVAVTSAWHAGHIWPSSLITSHMEDQEE